MAGDRPEMEFWERPPIETRRFMVSKSAVGVDKRGGAAE